MRQRFTVPTVRSGSSARARLAQIPYPPVKTKKTIVIHSCAVPCELSNIQEDAAYVHIRRSGSCAQLLQENGLFVEGMVVFLAFP